MVKCNPSAKDTCFIIKYEKVVFILVSVYAKLGFKNEHI